MFSWKRYVSTKNTAIYGKNFLCMCRHGFKYEELKIDTCIEVSFIHSLWKYPKYSFCADENHVYKSIRYSRVFIVQCLLKVSFLNFFFRFHFLSVTFVSIAQTVLKSLPTYFVKCWMIKTIVIHWRTRGGEGGRERTSPLGAIFFHFHTVFWKNWPSNR